jgi:hypothetical protein
VGGSPGGAGFPACPSGGQAGKPAPPAATTGYRWLVSPRYDLGFFIGSCALTFAFYGLYRVAHHWGFFLRGDSILITYLLFTALFDQPHIFQTFSRTHFDRQEFSRRRGLYTWGIAGFAAAGLVVTALGWEAQLIVAAAIVGTWHIIRQHWGFLKVYKAINGDLHPLDNWLDGLTFYTGMFACLFNDYSDLRGPIVIYRDLQARFPSLPAHAGELAWSCFLVLLVLFGLRQTWRVMEGKALNVPKLLLLAAALSTHYFVFFATATPFLVAEALETVYHDVQYQGWMMHYQRRQFPGVKQVVLKWFAAALLYGVVIGIIEIYGLLQYGWAVWLFAPFAMVVLFHYYADGLIWRFREQPELRALLAPAGQTPHP